MQALFRDARDRVRSMALVHEKLYQSQDLARVELGGYTRNLMSYLMQAYASVSRKIELALQLEEVSLPVDVAIPCGLILNELATNALKHAFEGCESGQIAVELRAVRGGRVHLTFRDNGRGFPPEFDCSAAESLGLRLVRMLTEQLQRSLAVENGKGTTFHLTFNAEGRKA